MHVLHVTCWHPIIDNSSGGFILQQCKSLAAEGIKIGIVFSRIQGLREALNLGLTSGVPAFITNNVPVPTYGFKSWNIPFLRKHVWRFNRLMLFSRYRSYIRHHGSPDLLHAHVALETGKAVSQIALRSGLKYVITEHSSELLGELPKHKIDLLRQIYQDAKLVFAVSNQIAKKISSISPLARVEVINNLIPDQIYNLRKNKSDTGFLKVVTIGNLVPGKKTENAIMALADVARTFPFRIEHHIIGDGPEKKKLKSISDLSPATTIYHGRITNLNAMSILSTGDMLLHPSERETFGIVLAEAMALGLPVIATRCGGPESFVTKEVGVLVEPNNLAALSTAILQMTKEITFWRSRKNDIAEYSKARFHEKVISNQIQQCYKQIISKSYSTQTKR